MPNFEIQNQNICKILWWPCLASFFNFEDLLFTLQAKSHYLGQVQEIK